jgi:hypothetical protein
MEAIGGQVYSSSGSATSRSTSAKLAQQVLWQTSAAAPRYAAGSAPRLVSRSMTARVVCQALAESLGKRTRIWFEP